MTKNLSYKLLILYFLIFSSCGFKPLKFENLNNYRINKISTEGSKLINFSIKNNINQLFIKSDLNAEEIDIIINSSKKRVVKEKNKKNEITKYEIIIETKIKIIKKETNKEFILNLNKQGEYQVGNKNIVTINNEKKLTKNLIKSLTDDIVKQLLINIDDF